MLGIMLEWLEILPGLLHVSVIIFVAVVSMSTSATVFFKQILLRATFLMVVELAVSVRRMLVATGVTEEIVTLP